MMADESIRDTLPRDALASVVVFLVALPLCMGIAIASGAPPVAGLVTGIIGGLVVGSIAGCPLQVSGPAAGLAVIVYELIRTHGFETLGPIIVLAGVLQIAAGAVGAGQVFRAVAPAVIYGMLAGIGILILAAQFHVMVDDQPRETGIQNLLAIPESVLKGILPVEGGSHHLAAILGLTTIAILPLWGRFVPPRIRWIPAALVGVVCATVISQLAEMPVRYVDLPDDLWSAIELPSLAAFSSLARTDILVAAAALAFVASAETLLSATAVDQMHDGKRTNYDRELTSQGVGNLLAGLAGGLPMTGVIVRSATNVAAGAKTRASTILHGLWLLLLVGTAPWVLRLVPTASLAAILVYTGYKLINPDNVKRLRRYGKMPVAIYAVTVVTIVGVDLLTGILCGLALTLAHVVYALSRLRVETRTSPGGRIDVHLQGAATFLRLPTLVDALEKLPPRADVHIHVHDLDYVDHACAEALSQWRAKRLAKTVDKDAEWRELMATYEQGCLREPARLPRPAAAAGSR
jgi:MFS superfamily sulfate permease-like transporter